MSEDAAKDGNVVQLPVPAPVRRLPPAAGRGRIKGEQNKLTRVLKDAILKAAEQAGNKVGKEGLISYLEHQAIENPGPFMGLLGKVLPLQVTGAGGGSIKTDNRLIIEIVRPSDAG